MEKQPLLTLEDAKECEHVELPNAQFYNHARQGEEPVIPHYAKEVLKGK